MKQKSDYSNEMEYIKDWCITVIDFKLEMIETSTLVKKLYEPLKKDLISNFSSKNKIIQKGFKEAYRSMKDEVRYWPDRIRTDLNNILYSKFGETINQKKEEEIRTIMKRGIINNDDEFRMVDEKVNEICQTNPEPSELSKLNYLLLKYEQNKK